MTLDGFLTFFGLVIAAYALLDPMTKLKFRLDAPGQFILFFSFAAVILVFQFILPILNSLPQNASIWIVELGFGQPSDLMDNHKISFILTVLWCIFSVLLFSLSRPSGRKLTRLLPLTNRLYDEGRYLELIELVAPYIKPLCVYQNRIHPLLKIHDWMVNAGSIGPPLGRMRGDSEWRAPKIMRPGIRKLANSLPKFHKRTHAAQSIVETVAKSPDIRRELQVHQAEFTVSFFRRFQKDTYDEFDKFIMGSMQNPESFLRNDIRSTVGTQGETYALSSKCVTLMGFLGDVCFAKDSGIWRPVAEAALKSLREDDDYRKALLGSPPFEDDDLFDDITYSAIHFFDIMITRAAYQGVEDNFWLMYMAIFVEKMLELPDVCRPQAEYAEEFPTLGSRDIYEAQSRLQNWVDLAWRLPEDNVHTTAESIEEAQDICAIPYWAAHSLCRALRAIILSPNVADSFKVERLDGFIRTASGIPQGGKSSYLREFLANGLIVGPFDIESKNISGNLDPLLSQTDHVYRSQFKELQAAMDE